MNIFCIDYQHAEILAGTGHNVLSPSLKPGIVSLPEVLERHAFTPDLVIQRERLGPRVLMSGLEKVPCTTVFIAIDTHLNMFWQRHYVRLFDLALTPHLSLFRELTDDEGRLERYDNVRRLRHVGLSRPWRDYQARTHDISFCGVVDEHRPLRKAMLDLLSDGFPLYRPEGRIRQPEMFDLFSDSRIIPNESIAKEVNFRLFEGASCGCLVLGQNIGEDQDVCFEPGKEVILYEHGLELLDRCAFYLKNRREAQMIARRAWARVHAEHLPEHRVNELLLLSHGAAGRARGAEASKQFLLTLLQFSRHGSIKSTASSLFSRMLELPDDAEVAAALLTLLAEAAQPESPLYDAGNARPFIGKGLEFCRSLASKKLHAGSTACNLVASCFALYYGEVDLAAEFVDRQKKHLAATGRPVPELDLAATASAGFYSLYIFWSEVLLGQNKLAQSGFQLRLLRGFIPGSALECLLLAQAESDGASKVSPDNRDLTMRLHSVCSRLSGYFSFMDMGFLAHLFLYEQQSWSWQFQYGVSALKCLSVSTGLLEIGESWNKAVAAGEERFFTAMLADAPASGYIQRVLNI